jgi:putative membrane protein
MHLTTYKGVGFPMNSKTYWAAVLISAFLGFCAISCEKSNVQAEREPTNNSDQTANKSLSMDDRNFLIKAEKAMVREKTLAQVALQKTRNNDVRAFAQKIFDDRSRALDELVRLTNTNGLAQPFSLSDVELEAKTQFDRTSEDAFDHEFVSLMAAELQDVVSNFSMAAETAENPGVRNYASRVLPLLRKDLDSAADLEKKL